MLFKEIVKRELPREYSLYVGGNQANQATASKQTSHNREVSGSRAMLDSTCHDDELALVYTMLQCAEILGASVKHDNAERLLRLLLQASAFCARPQVWVVYVWRYSFEDEEVRFGRGVLNMKDDTLVGYVSLPGE